MEIGKLYTYGTMVCKCEFIEVNSDDIGEVTVCYMRVILPGESSIFNAGEIYKTHYGQLWKEF